jgi:N-acetylneuraminic acid mutarotase
VNGLRPPAREEHTAVWDPVRHQMLIYGGTRSGRVVDDLWSYRPATDTWTELQPDSQWPAARFRHAATWDATLGRMVVSAGYSGGLPGRYLDDLWSYDPATGNWQQLAMNGPRPTERARHSLLADPRSGRLLLFGGFAGGIDYLADLWSYDPAADAWTSLATAGSPPSPRAGAMAAWDTARGQMLVYGGGAGSDAYAELWSYRPAR